MPDRPSARSPLAGATVGRGRRLASLGIASAGILVGHWLTYLIDVPHAQARALELARTGHGYLSAAGELATAFAALTLAAMFLGRLVAPDRGDRPTTSVLATRLGSLQVGAFLALELTERVLARSGLQDLANGRIVLTGVGVQLAVGLMGALLLRAVLRLAAQVAATLPARAPAFARMAHSRLPAPRAARPRPRVAAGGPGLRAPPSPVVG